jgi:hypothetical protein
MCIPKQKTKTKNENPNKQTHTKEKKNKIKKKPTTPHSLLTETWIDSYRCTSKTLSQFNPPRFTIN